MIGRGSFGTVYKGTWKGGKVALKRISIPPGVDRAEMVSNSCELNALKYVSKPYLQYAPICQNMYKIGYQFLYMMMLLYDFE